MRNKPKGLRGIWFALWGGGQYPIFWKRQFKLINGEPYLITDWRGNERENTGYKRDQVRAHCKEHLNTGQPIIVVLAEQKESEPSRDNVPAIKKFISVYNVLVEAVEPEIKLKIVSRLWG